MKRRMPARLSAPLYAKLIVEEWIRRWCNDSVKEIITRKDQNTAGDYLKFLRRMSGNHACYQLAINKIIEGRA